MELCLLHTQKKIVAHSKKKLLHSKKKKIDQISSKVLTLKTASGHQKKTPRPGIEPGASAWQAEMLPMKFSESGAIAGNRILQLGEVT